MTEIIKINNTEIHLGDSLESMRRMPDESVNCVVTSPPYLWLRDYGTMPVMWPEVSFSPMPGLPEITIPAEECELGLESSIWTYVGHIVLIIREVSRILKKEGVLWLNLGDCHIKSGAPGGGDPTIGTRKLGETGWNESYPNRKAPKELKPKNLAGVPWRVAFALQADGWFFRMDNIWHKPNPMPESCKDRCTKAHEYVFLLSKSARYYYDYGAIREVGSPDSIARYARGRSGNHKWSDGGPGNQSIAKSFDHMKVPSGWETGKGSHNNFHRDGRAQKTSYTFARKTATQGMPGAPDQHREERRPICYVGTRNKRSVWTVPTHPYKGAHFATFPPKLIEPCILAGCPRGGTVLDPFGGSGTTAFVANAYGRKAILCELNPGNIPLIRDRLGVGHEAETEIEPEGLFA